jgi:DNA-binding MarR family transcriptional regulator
MDNINEKAHIFGSIFIIANRLQVLGDKFDKNITIKQWLLLIGILKSNTTSPTVSEVASFIGNSRQNVKKMALILEKKGFIRFEKDPKDARILRVSLTDKCEAYFKKRENRELDFFEKLYEDFDTELVKGLNDGITRLEENIIRMENQND